ncbi:MAG TPA: OmpH family outer membrane protein [Blastocatellia bacterium]|jgi:outer membrane protein
MKLLRLPLALLALLVLTVGASAQQTSTSAPPQAGLPQAGAPPALVKGKIAVLNTALFQEQVGEFRVKREELNRQFEPRSKELEGLANRITALENTLKSQTQVLSAAKIAEMNEQLNDMKKDYQRRGEDLQAEAERAQARAFQPLSEKLGKFAEEYARKRGIVLLVDLANSVQSGTVLWFDRRSEVTQDFINEYNKAHPVPNAPATTSAPPAQKKP